MSCEHLICARCLGPVVEGRCPICRTARAEVHDQGTLWGSPLLLAALILALTLVIVAQIVS